VTKKESDCDRDFFVHNGERELVMAQRRAMPRLAAAVAATAAAAAAALQPATGATAGGWPHLPPRSCASSPSGNHCKSPGTCAPPAAALHSAVAIGPSPGMQWNLAGGFCGAFSVQQAALSAGAWISQDLVRKANIGQPGAHNMHGSSNCSADPLGCGWEVMPSNVKWTAEHLRLASDEFDYTQPSPQAAAWKCWAKHHLVKQHAIAFFPMCAGDSHACYAGSCPNGGHTDHVECMYGIWSNHSLDDLTPYPDDIVLHTSNQDCFPYYRPMGTLEDSTSMAGNCAKAGHGWGQNEAYPCIDSNVTYGLAVSGLQVMGTVGQTSLSTGGLTYEVRRSHTPCIVLHCIVLHGIVNAAPACCAD